MLISILLHIYSFASDMLYRRYYMIAHVLSNVLNEFGISERMRGLLSIVSPFRNEFNKFNYTRAWMLDSIYQIIK